MRSAEAAGRRARRPKLAALALAAALSGALGAALGVALSAGRAGGPEGGGPGPAGAPGEGPGRLAAERLRLKLAEAEREVEGLRARAAREGAGAPAAPGGPAERSARAAAGAAPEDRPPPQLPPERERVLEADCVAGEEAIEALWREAADPAKARRLLLIHAEYVARRREILRRYLLGEIDRETLLGLNRAFYEKAEREVAALGDEAEAVYRVVSAGGRLRLPESEAAPERESLPVPSRGEGHPTAAATGTPPDRPPPLAPPRLVEIALARRSAGVFAAWAVLDEGSEVQGGMVVIEFDPASISLARVERGPDLPPGFEAVTEVNAAAGRAVAILFGPLRPERPGLPAGPARLISIEGTAFRTPAALRVAAAQVEVSGWVHDVAGRGLELR